MNANRANIAAHAAEYAEGLNAAFPHIDHAGVYHFTADKPGNKFGRVVLHTGNQRSVHAFVDAEGNVYKAAGWTGPAAGIRYSSVSAALAAAATYAAGWAGGYLYADGIVAA